MRFRSRLRCLFELLSGEAALLSDSEARGTIAALLSTALAGTTIDADEGGNITATAVGVPRKGDGLDVMPSLLGSDDAPPERKLSRKGLRSKH